jgi:hypothetical protein
MKRGGKAADRGRKVEDTYFGEDPFQSFRRFAADFRDVSREPDALLCRHLRAQAWSVTHPVVERPDPAPEYCCLKTLRRHGPDGLDAHPDDCTDERGCFEPADHFREPES